jgi:hypothetical protein
MNEFIYDIEGIFGPTYDIEVTFKEKKYLERAIALRNLDMSEKTDSKMVTLEGEMEPRSKETTSLDRCINRKIRSFEIVLREVDGELLRHYSSMSTLSYIDLMEVRALKKALKRASSK